MERIKGPIPLCHSKTLCAPFSGIAAFYGEISGFLAYLHYWAGIGKDSILAVCLVAQYLAK